MKSNELAVVSLFSGAMGLDLGLESAGLDVRVAVECDRHAAECIRRNRPKIALIEKRIERVSTAEILAAGGLSHGGVFAVVGGPCCQAFSTAGHRASVEEKRGSLFRHFTRVVREIRPRFFVMENVKGMLSAAVRHRPMRERGPGFPPLARDEELGSAFAMILRVLKKTGYRVVFDVLDAANYGVPQRRHRLIIIGSRDGEAIELPRRTHAEHPSAHELPWRTLREAIGDIQGGPQSCLALAPSKMRVMLHVPEGGNWRDIPKRLQRKAMGGAYDADGGRTAFYRRLAWDRPCPSLTTRPDMLATLLCHPTEQRSLSIEEYARIQEFPAEWQFVGGLDSSYAQIGNAVPTGLGKAIGNALLATACRQSCGLPAEVICADEKLVARLTKRSRTSLCAPRFRDNTDEKSARAWMLAIPGGAVRRRATRVETFRSLLKAG